ncbi:ChaN family lipoprotein [Geopsychrobacter electrodiphilus]|uniref:ChaN family lipoprotein n=1 Tax=Geopsychrobacter electrodiphilus TaxID=225196 RepID=UPI00037ECC80|nr:ChaN family lipoprotein [Geopsychrobacter electrodiphilus]
MKQTLVSRLTTAAIGLILLSLTACTTNPRLLGNPEMPYPFNNPRVGDLFHVATGHRVSEQEMLAAIGDTRVVYVGETHDNPASHQLQVDVLAGLFQKNPGGVTLAMEMFTPEQQPLLDRWTAGELTEAEFLRQVKWFENWQMNFALYRPLLDFCRDKHIPVIALNAPKSLVHKVGRTPLTELPKELRAQLPELDFTDIYQRSMTESIYSGHSMGKAMRDGFIRVQTLWDETMAQNLVTYLRSPLGEDRQVVVVAGGNHVRYGFGIPRRVHRRLPVSYLLIGSQEIEIPKEREAELMDVKMPGFPMRAWDYLKLTRYEKVKTGVKLGVGIEEDPRGILVTMVLPDSSAAKAGLLKGDILLQAQTTELKERFDLLYLLMNMQKGESLQLKIQRGEEHLLLTAEF